MNYQTLVNEITDMYERGKYYAEKDCHENSEEWLHKSGYEEGTYQHIAFLKGYHSKKFCIKHKDQIDRLIIKA